MDGFHDKRFAEAIRDEGARKRFSVTLRRKRTFTLWLSMLVMVLAVISYFIPVAGPLGCAVLLVLAVMAWTLSLKYETEMRLLTSSETKER